MWLLIITLMQVQQAHERDWYLTIDLEERRDVIEYPIVDEIDINGWDLRKALQLFRKSNPALIEWLLSPITYIERDGFREKMLALMPQVYALEKGMYHYLNMAKGTYCGHLEGDRVSLKKYFYALRPLLAIRWLQTQNEPAPIEFQTLLTTLDDEALLAEIDSLLAQKATSQEKAFIAKNAILDQFIRSEIARHETVGFDSPHVSYNIDLLNTLFREMIHAD